MHDSCSSTHMIEQQPQQRQESEDKHAVCKHAAAWRECNESS